MPDPIQGSVTGMFPGLKSANAARIRRVGHGPSVAPWPRRPSVQLEDVSLARLEACVDARGRAPPAPAS